MQKKTKIISIVIAIIVLAIIGIFISQIQKPIIITNSQFQNKLLQSTNIKVILDKNSYSQDEKVKITIQNNYEESIFIPSAFKVNQIYRKDGEKWIVLDSYCNYPYCIYKLLGPEEIKSGQSKEIEWNPIYFIKRDSKPLKAGEYIISIDFRFELDSSKDKNWKVAYSDLFIIQ